MRRAIIITGKSVQDHEFIYPFYRLQEADYQVDVAVRGKETVEGFLGTKVVPTVDIPSDPGEMKRYDLIVLPGGAKALEYLRQDKGIIHCVRQAHQWQRVIASICHGSQLLISACIVKGNRISGYYSIRDDINNAGATYVDAPVVIDDRIVTSPHYKYSGVWMKAALAEVEKNGREDRPASGQSRQSDRAIRKP